MGTKKSRLHVTEFTSLEHARTTLHAWKDDYNHPDHMVRWATRPPPRIRPTRSGWDPAQLRNSGYELTRYGANVRHC